MVPLMFHRVRETIFTGIRITPSGNGTITTVTNPINTTLPYVSSRNNFRYDPYHRLDFGVNFNKQKKHGRRTWNISVYNLYNQLNPFLTTVTSKSVVNPATG